MNDDIILDHGDCGARVQTSSRTGELELSICSDGCESDEYDRGEVIEGVRRLIKAFNIKACELDGYLASINETRERPSP